MEKIKNHEVKLIEFQNVKNSNGKRREQKKKFHIRDYSNLMHQRELI